MVKAQEDAGNLSFSSMVHYKHFRWAWYSFLALLDVDYSTGFQCSRCGTYPQVLVMDATSLSFRRELGFWDSPVMVDTSNKRVHKGRLVHVTMMCTYALHHLYKSSFSSRVLISDRKTRQCLANYAKKSLSNVEMEEMMKLIDQNAPFLRALIEHVDEDVHLNIHHCSRHWKKFIECLSSASPVCALIPPTDVALKLIAELCERDVTSDPEVQTVISIHSVNGSVFIGVEANPRHYASFLSTTFTYWQLSPSDYVGSSGSDEGESTVSIQRL